MPDKTVSVIGAGLAGCEAAWKLAESGFTVDLYEMKPEKYSPAHKYVGFAELVCSNSLKADRISSAGGLLKEEMRRLDSLLLQCADTARVPAGGALAVDRAIFSDLVTERIRSNGNIRIISGEVTEIPDRYVIVATGPLTSDTLARYIAQTVGRDYLSFYDAAAPIISAESVDMEKAFKATRYDRGDDDYINLPFDKIGYEKFWNAIVSAESVSLKEFESGMQVYEGCMPVEVMAKRGIETLRFGPLKPVGLKDPSTGHRPWAVAQLRNENSGGSLLNIVGFQTNLTFPEQKRVFSMIPGLENAEFVRYGVMHRNTFLDSPRLLDATFALKGSERIAFAGQITGVEGYMESAASGIIAAVNMARRINGQPPLILPEDTMIGALSRYISDESIADFQPMGANMGLLPPLPEKVRGKQLRYAQVAERSLKSLDTLLKTEI